MIENKLRKYLQEFLIPPVHLTKPQTVPSEWVSITRLGGRTSIGIESASISIKCYAPTLSAAHGIHKTVADALIHIEHPFWGVHNEMVSSGVHTQDNKYLYESHWMITDRED